MAVLKRRNESRSRFVDVGVKNRFALGADHRDRVAFLQTQFFASIPDMMELDELSLLGDLSAG